MCKLQPPRAYTEPVFSFCIDVCCPHLPPSRHLFSDRKYGLVVPSCHRHPRLSYSTPNCHLHHGCVLGKAVFLTLWFPDLQRRLLAFVPPLKVRSMIVVSSPPLLSAACAGRVFFKIMEGTQCVQRCCPVDGNIASRILDGDIVQRRRRFVR